MTIESFDILTFIIFVSRSIFALIKFRFKSAFLHFFHVDLFSFLVQLLLFIFDAVELALV